MWKQAGLIIIKKNTAYKSIISNKFKINNVNIIGYLIAGFWMKIRK
jgi:hypothetical protein